MIQSTILSNLNEEQKLPASTIDGAILVTAGAGSGKTRMLTHRIAHMVKELGIEPFTPQEVRPKIIANVNTSGQLFYLHI